VLIHASGLGSSSKTGRPRIAIFTSRNASKPTEGKSDGKEGYPERLGSPLTGAGDGFGSQRGPIPQTRGPGIGVGVAVAAVTSEVGVAVAWVGTGVGVVAMTWTLWLQTQPSSPWPVWTW
jgi:hypothetical protein